VIQEYSPEKERPKKKTKTTTRECVTLCGLDIYIIQKVVILMQKKNHENSNISPCKYIIFKKFPKKETKIQIL